jgi:hypothetical protein
LPDVGLGLPLSEILPLLSPTLTRREARAILRHGITYPLFVPDLGTTLVKLLVAGSNPRLLVEELNRLTLLGSGNAAALLTLLDTRGALNSGEYANAALERCRTSAAAGNAYAQYVMGWVNRKLGMSVEAFRCLTSASVGMFLPAMIDTARFAAGGAGVKSRDPQAALRIMWTAHKMGHRAALTFIARYWMKGAAGWFARLAGLLLYFPAVLRAAHYATRHPLSEKIFVLPLKDEPLLRGERN